LLTLGSLAHPTESHMEKFKKFISQYTTQIHDIEGMQDVK